MTKYLELLILAFLSFSSLGLISCGSDKEAGEAWGISEPLIITSNNETLNFNQVKASLQRSIKHSDKLKFYETKGIELKITSQCNDALSKAQQTWIRPLPRELPFSEIIPQHIMFDRKNMKLTELTCSFDFMVTKQSASNAHKFKLDKIKISNTSPLKGSKIPIITPELIYESFREDFPIETHEVNLMCQNFSLKSFWGSDPNILNSSVNQYQRAEALKAFSDLPQQMCRLSTNQKDILTHYSSIFQLRQAANILRAKMLPADSLSPNNIDYHYPVTTQFFSVLLENFGDTDVNLVLDSKTIPAASFFRMTWNTKLRSYRRISTPMSATSQLTTSRDNSVKLKNGLWQITVPKNKEIELHLSVKHYNKCVYPPELNQLRVNTNKKDRQGFLYKMNSPLVLQQVNSFGQPTTEPLNFIYAYKVGAAHEMWREINFEPSFNIGPSVAPPLHSLREITNYRMCSLVQ